LTKAKAAAAKALLLDGSLAEAHEAMGHVGLLHEGNWSSVEEEYVRALKLNPDYATAFQRYAVFLTIMKRQTEALAMIRRAQQMEPLSLIINSDVALVLMLNQRMNEAIEQCERTIELDANFAVTHFVLGLSRLESGELEQAIAAFQKSAELSGGAPTYLSALAHAHAAAGHPSEANSILARLESDSRGQYASPYYKVLVYAGMGDFKSAVDAAKQAVDEGSTWIIHLHISVDPRLRPLQNDPVFRSLMENLKLPN